MFKITQSETYTWPVSFKIPVDGAKYIDQTFDAQFKRLTQTRLTEIADDLDSKDEEKKIDKSEVVREVLVGWQGIVDESGDVPFSVGSLEKLLEVPMLTTAILSAFFDSISGAAKRKN